MSKSQQTQEPDASSEVSRESWRGRLARLDAWGKVPGNTRASMLNYLADRTPPGGFLTAVLCNDLAGAVGAADLNNRARLVPIVEVVFSGFPSNAWGTPEKVAAWLEGREGS